MRKIFFSLIISCYIICGTAFASDSNIPAEIIQREKHLATQLRCLVCQNQSLADSNADLAGDMRQEIKELMVKGNSDQQVIDILVGRYGDFVLYRPPFKAQTLVLWILPIILLLFGLWWLICLLQKKSKQPTNLISDDITKQAQQLLKTK